MDGAGGGLGRVRGNRGIQKRKRGKEQEMGLVTFTKVRIPLHSRYGDKSLRIRQVRGNIHKQSEPKCGLYKYIVSVCRMSTGRIPLGKIASLTLAVVFFLSCGVTPKTCRMASYLDTFRAVL